MKLEKKNQGASTALLTLLVAAVLLVLDQIAKYFVLQKLKAEQKKAFLANSERAAEAALEILKHGVEAAQQKYNGAAL